MELKKYFQIAVDKLASDIHLVGGEKPMIRLEGKLEAIDEIKLDNDQLTQAIFSALITAEQKKYFERNKELDFSWQLASAARFRVNLHYQSSKIGLAARLVPAQIPSSEWLDLNETLYNLTHLKDGLIIVSGPTGCGKSSTLAGMIEIINQERPAHIITIEDPIEFIFQDKQCMIEQRELGIDTSSFAAALKHVLRQDPNIIMVGEMRDLETIQMVLTAAETGHLVLSTLHTSSAAETIDRIIDVFPPHKQRQILIQLATTLRAVVCQQLLPKSGGGRVVAREVLINTAAVANLIRENKANQLVTAMQLDSKDGMQTMNMALADLFHRGLITEDIFNRRTPQGMKKGTYY